MKNNPIGIFDSGIGGLTVVREVLKQLPDESIIYLGDTARVPYGTRGNKIITKFALQLVSFLIKQQVKVLVVACNTISAICLEEIKKISPVPVIGVITPAATVAAQSSTTKKIGVIGTNATISSKVYEKEIKLINPQLSVLTQACPLFVPLAEEGLTDHEATKLIAKEYLKKLSDSGIDTLILGCTHYPVLRDIIKESINPKIQLIDSASPTAKELKKILAEKSLESDNKKGKYKFLVTDAPNRVKTVAEILFKGPLPGKIKLVTL